MAGLDIKESVRVATTHAGNLAIDFLAGEIVDGVILLTGDRILIKNQENEYENGIYVVQPEGPPFRSHDADDNHEVTRGMCTYVEEGDYFYVLTTEDPITVGVTPLNFAPLTNNNINGDNILQITENQTVHENIFPPSEEGTLTDNESEACKICFECVANTVIIPCGHINSCVNCIRDWGNKNKGCPACKQDFTKVIKVYTT